MAEFQDRRREASVQMYQSRKLWEDQVDEIETENRENIRHQIREEDLRKFNAKPEPSTPDNTGLPSWELLKIPD